MRQNNQSQFKQPSSQPPKQINKQDLQEQQNLLKRIYDKGFQKQTMPSVKRPETTVSQNNPLNVKIFPKNKGAGGMKRKLSPLKTQAQSTILHSKDAKQKRPEFLDDFQKFDNQEEEDEQNDQDYVDEKQKNMAQTGFKQTMGVGQKFQKSIYNSQQQNQLAPYQQGVLSMPIPQFQASTTSYGKFQGFTGISFAQKQLGETLRQSMQSFATGQGEVADAEFQRKQYLIAKITGKFDIDKRYLNRLPPIHDNQNRGQTSGGFGGEATQDDYLFLKHGEKTDNQFFQGQQKRAPSKLDKYIDLILKNVRNIDEFIYLAKKDSDDPYDLKVISYSLIKGQATKGSKSYQKTDDSIKPIREYYTISKKGLCHYLNGKPTEFIALPYWLKERETYEQIKSLKFFENFRKWKTLKMWKKNVIRFKMNNMKRDLEDKLFLANPILGKTLLHHRRECTDMEKLKFVEISVQQLGLQADVPLLEGLKMTQETKRQQVIDQIISFSRRCRDNIRTGFADCLNVLKQQQQTSQVDDDFGQQNEGQNFLRLKESSYENLGFSDNMSYEQRSELRKECSKFLRFSYLVDFLALESLKNIYENSVQEVLDELDKVVNNEEKILICLDKTNRPSSSIRDPLFQTFIEFDPKPIESQHIEIEVISEFIPHPLGQSKVQDFNLIHHLKLRPPREERQAGKKDEQEQGDVRNEFQTYNREIVPNLTNRWLNLKPSALDFCKEIRLSITEGLQKLKNSFERWSRHDEMTPYATVLEEWDDWVGDGWDAPTNNYLNVSDWLSSEQNEDYKPKIDALVSKAYNRADNFMQQFHEPLMMHYENQKAQLEIFKDDNLFGPDESLQYTLELLNYQKEKMKEVIPISAEMGLFRLQCETLQEALIPSPELLISKLQNFMPDLLRERNKQYKEWLTFAERKIGKLTQSIEEFVDQTNYIKQVEREFPAIKGKLDILKNQFFTIKDEGGQGRFKFEIKKEDEVSQAEIQKYAEKLQQTIQEAQESQEKKTEGFKMTLQKQLIPDLTQRTTDLANIIRDNSKFLQLELGEANAIEQLLKNDQVCIELEKTKQNINHYEATFDLEESQFQDLEILRFDLNLRIDLWKSLRDWKILSAEWQQCKFFEIDTNTIRAKAEQFQKIVSKCTNNLPPNEILNTLRDYVDKFKETMPIVNALKNQFLTPRHWEEIKQKIKRENFDTELRFTLQELLDMQLLEYVKDISEISTQATQENVLQNEFNKIKKQWDEVVFITDKYQGKSDKTADLVIFKGVEEINEQFDEMLANMNNILGSRYLKTLKEEAEKLKNEIVYAQETFDIWIQCQKDWMHLMNIFNSKDIRQRLPEQANWYDDVNKNLRQKMKDAKTANKIRKAIDFNKAHSKNSIKNDLMKYKKTLEDIEKALESYLETKCEAFPRFYFLSNDDLLDILANSSDLQKIQPHMKKLFDNIYKLYLKDEGSSSISGMISAENEVIEFQNNVSTKSSEVEDWLRKVQEAMVNVLKRLMKKGKNDYNRQEREDWVKDETHCGQVITTIGQYMWCDWTENYIQQMDENNAALAEWLQININQLNSLTELIRGDLTSIRRKIIVALITQDVHARDIVDKLGSSNVSSIQTFYWQQQLRYYWDQSTDIIFIKQVNAQINYGYEYQGCTSRLVITPLTDRCWITITGALNLKLGANPAGPAGTGKTESVKDLAKGLAIFCVVFNCSEQINYQIMGKTFSGLAQCGAWSCLDEFNRIDIEVLSVIAQQLRQIRDALLKDQQTFYFSYNRKEVKIEKNVGICITMNPGYAGRTELPDNLKVLFRPVAMMIPDYALIAEIMLYAEGFENAQPLSKKMTQLYKLSSEQLSQQKHYDFGMRAVKSVLVMAGALKRQEPDLNEDAVLIRAMKDSNIPKFLKEDLPLFNALIQDLFPGIQIPVSNYQEFLDGVHVILERNKLQKSNKLETKIVELYETFNVRFGVMIVGLTCSGKTTCYEVLQKTMAYLREEKNSPDQKYQVVNTDIINPKCISMGELYGEVDVYSQEWHDGLASYFIRNGANEEGNTRRWVVFDGPVDALWIENMNTVLDDNMMLCLANGQRIKLRHQMRMLFEVNDLEVASPATVSRCGMVYMMYEDLGWRPYVQTWLEKKFGRPQNDEIDKKKSDDYNKVELEPELHKQIFALFENTIDGMLDNIRNKWQEPIPTADLQLVISLCNLLEVFISPEYGFNKSYKIEKQKQYINYAFTFSYIWSLGASIKEEFKPRVDNYVRDKLSQAFIPNAANNVYEVFFKVEGDEIEFKLWNDLDERNVFTYNKDETYFNMLVPTIDTIRYSFVIKWLQKFTKKTYVTGATGTGKTVIINNMLRESKEVDKIDTVNLIFSAQTSSIVTQQSIISKLDTKKKTQIGARPGRTVCIFIDDINMPAVEQYGAQPPIELLRFLADKGGFYHRQQFYFIEVVQTAMLACSAPPEGGRNKLTPRFTRHFNMLNVPQSSHETLTKIFVSILKGFFEAFSFQEVIQRSAESVVAATIDVYQTILEEKKPIPSKFHYTFNLRDVSKVFQGILMVIPTLLRDEVQLQKLWVHEVQRVFYDRLINQEDRQWFEEMIITLLARHLGSRLTREEIFVEKKIFFGDLMKLLNERAITKNYEQITDMVRVNKILGNILDDYNSENLNKMNLVFFEYAIMHLLRIQRVLRQPRGNIMLIGVGGSGKQSLTKLASFMYNIKFKQIEITKGFNHEDFKEFIREQLLFPSGIDGTKISFLFTDTQIIIESFVEDINNLLNTGEVPNIWENEHREKIKNQVSEIHEKLGRINEPDLIYQTFVERVRENLHIVLCMSPVGDALRVRCRKFPSLIDCCTLDWFASWPGDALYSVAERMLADFNLPSKEMREHIASMCKEIHIQGIEYSEMFQMQLKRKVYQTPKSYLDLINLYMSQLNFKRDELSTYQRRLTGGLSKLEQANKQVAQLKIDLTELKPKLVEQSRIVEETLITVSKEKAEADAKSLQVEVEAEKVQSDKNEVEEKTREVEVELSEVQPELDKAEEEVKKIDIKELQTLKKLPQPPAIATVVFEGVCLLFKKKDSDWKTAQALMNDLNEFVSNLKNYDKDNIPESIINKLRRVVNGPEYKPEIVYNKVSYLKGICVWVRSMFTYSQVAKKVAPKKALAEEMNKKLQEAEAILKKKLDELQQVKDRVARLQQESEDNINKKQLLEAKKEKTEIQLVNAEKLTTLLADEGIRWAESAKQINTQIINLIGDVFLSAALISYCGPFTGEYRLQMINRWQQQIFDLKIPISERFSLVNTLGSPIKIREWEAYGLPSDSTSHENAIFATKGYRWPLMIDPQLQANKWIKEYEKQNDLRILKEKDQRFALELKNAILQGLPILIQDVGEKLEALLEPILTKQIFTSADGRKLIHFGDSDIDYNEDFRLYLTTKMPNPHYLPEIFIKVNIINFTVTFQGLQDQLLAKVVQNEKPEIESQRDENIKNLANYKKNLEDCEKSILKGLDESEADNILDDTQLIGNLETSKETSKQVTIKIAESTELEESINKTRMEYMSVAIRGSILYFVIKDLSNIDPMYQYSLQYIIKLFNFAMRQTKPERHLEKRLELLIDSIMKTIYTNVCRGLFEAHKLIFSFCMCAQILKERKVLSEDLWSVFLRGASIYDKSKAPENPDKQTISQISWDLACFLSEKFEKFQELAVDIKQNYSTTWHKFQNCINPITEPLPQNWADKLDQFDKLIIIKIFRPEKILFGVSNYVLNHMGKFYLETPSVSMASIYADSDVITPIIFVLSQGADPTEALLKYAEEQNRRSDMAIISLGQGQEQITKDALEEGKRKGNWVLLQNCHLARTFMPMLELKVEELKEQEDAIIKTFRLFLTSMPAEFFPVSVLQNGIKLTTEPPRGIRANLKRTFAELDEKYLSSCESKPNEFNKLFIGLTFFHAIIQERRKFGPLGWNIRYEFNDSDLDTSKNVLFNLLSEQDIVPWDALIYVTGHINYGGRVTDDWDRLCLIRILEKFYNTKILNFTEKYQFSQAKDYYVPPVGTLDQYKEYIENLPLEDDPAVFGMHENANINYQTQQSDALINTILSISPKQSGGSSGKSNDSVVIELSETILAEMPANLNKEDGYQDMFVKNDQDLIPSLSTVLLQEMSRFNTLLNAMRLSLTNLIKAIKGLIVMSSELDSMYSNLINNRVPANWESVGYLSLKPLASWLRDLYERIKFMNQWLTEGNPTCFWISGFFFPQGFMTGVLQTHAREYKIAIDKLTFQFKIMEGGPETIHAKQKDGVYVYGLYIEGAAWDKKKHTIMDQAPGQMFQQMPTIYFQPTDKYEKLDENYACPVYKTSVRAGVLSTTGQSTNFILAVDIPSANEETSYWTLRGAALLTQLND